MSLSERSETKRAARGVCAGNVPGAHQKSADPPPDWPSKSGVAVQTHEPGVDQLELNRREVERVDTDVELVGTVRPEVALVRVAVDERDASINRSMLTVPFSSGGVAGVWVVRREQPDTATGAIQDLGEHRPSGFTRAFQRSIMTEFISSTEVNGRPASSLIRACPK